MTSTQTDTEASPTPANSYRKTSLLQPEKQHIYRLYPVLRLPGEYFTHEDVTNSAVFGF
jgi:hypothetical protein